MRHLLLLLLVSSACCANAQRVDWSHVSTGFGHRLAPAHLTRRQQAAVRALVLHRATVGDMIPDDCSEVSERGVGTFTLEAAPVGRAGIVYVTPGAGCLQTGAQNYPYWLVDVAGDRPRIIASEWGGIGVEPHISHGLHDIVVPHFEGAVHKPLDYLRFNGVAYRLVGQNELTRCSALDIQTKDDGWCLPKR